MSRSNCGTLANCQTNVFSEVMSLALINDSVNAELIMLTQYSLSLSRYRRSKQDI